MIERLEGTRGLVVVKRAIDEDTLNIAMQAFSLLRPKEELESNYRHFVTDTPTSELELVANRISSVVFGNMSDEMNGQFRYALVYRDGEGIHPHRDTNDEGGFRVALCLFGSGTFFTSMLGQTIDSIDTSPGDLIIQDLGKGVEHGVNPINGSGGRVTMVWDFHEIFDKK